MSASKTPRTAKMAVQAETGVADDYSEYYVRADFARNLETELTAALARVAELEKTQAICHCGQRMIDHGWQDGHGGTPNNELCAYAEQVIEYRDKNESLTRQLTEAHAQLASRAEAVPASTWQSIETAPRNGVRVLGFSPDWIREDYNREGIRECFCDGDEIWYSPDWDNEFDVFQNGNCQPTHWQPLPPPPTGKELGD